MKSVDQRMLRLMASSILTFLATGCASLHTSDMQAGYPAERIQVEQRLQEVFTAAENKDFARLDGFHLYGAKFTKFTDASPERLDAVAGRKGEHDGLGALQGLKMRADDLKIDLFGAVAIATFIADSSYEANGKVTHSKQRGTLVFVQEKGDWKIAHEHFSRINP